MSVDTAELHAQLDELEAQGANWQRIMTAHALVESGHVTAIECAMPRCIYDSREFKHGTRPLSMSIDHIVPLRDGGTHYPDNLRLAHHGCNGAAASYDESRTHALSIRMRRMRREQLYKKRNAELLSQPVKDRDDRWLERWLKETETWAWLESTHKLQSTVYHVKYETLQGDELANYIINNVIALENELHEFLGEVQWKDWANERGRVNRDEAVDELVDVGHFLANLLVVLGVSDAEWETRYLAKQRRNAERQRVPGGYTGEKCPNCRRELDRPGSLVTRDGIGVGDYSYVYCAHCDTQIKRLDQHEQSDSIDT